MKKSAAATARKTAPPGAGAGGDHVSPSFALLRERRRLRVLNPENGARFTVSLREWAEVLWAVRVHPEPPWRQPGNAYTTAHRILPRTVIEEWLAELRLTP